MYETAVQSYLIEGGTESTKIVKALILKSLTSQMESEIRSNFFFQFKKILSYINSEDAINLGTAFFWSNVKTAYFYCDTYENELGLQLLINSFDSFYYLIPTEFEININSYGQELIFPKLGFKIKPIGNNLLLKKISNNEIQLKNIDFSQTIYLGTIDSQFSMNVCYVSEHQVSRVLCPNNSLIFFGLDFEKSLCEFDVREFADKISDSLEIIQKVDANLFRQINELIEWYIPINSIPNSHSSFTSPFLEGVIFLSFSENPLIIAEAIIHENGHRELNTLLQVEKIHNDNNESKYYSPWRADARPLTGLIHAIYVFSIILNFYANCIENCFFTELSILNKMKLYYEKIIIGCKYLPKQHLTVIGEKIITDVLNRIDRISSKFKLNDAESRQQLELQYLLFKNNVSANDKIKGCVE